MARKIEKKLFAQPVRKLNADEIAKISGAGPIEEPIFGKTGGGQDNTGHTGFN